MTKNEAPTEEEGEEEGNVSFGAVSIAASRSPTRQAMIVGEDHA
jgi:hypothetical protein